MSGAPELPIEIWTKIFSYLDYESLQDNATLVCKEWFEIIRNSSNLSGRLVLHLPMKPPNMDMYMGFMDIEGPGRQAGQFDCMTSTLTASSGKFLWDHGSFNNPLVKILTPSSLSPLHRHK